MSEPAYAVDIGAQNRLGKLTGQTQDRPVYLVQNNHRLFGQLLTANFSNGAYGWQQVSPIGGGQWMKTPNGLFGTTIQNPAFEKTLNPSVPLGSIVDLEVGALSKSNPPGQDYRFAYCCGGSCAGSGSGSGSGGGGGNIITVCCPAGLPSNLHIQFTNGSASPVGTCEPIQDLLVPIAWDGSEWTALILWHFNGTTWIPTFISPAPVPTPPPTAANPVVSLVQVRCNLSNPSGFCTQTLCNPGFNQCVIPDPGTTHNTIGPGFTQFSVVTSTALFGGGGCNGAGTSCDALSSCSPPLMHFFGNMCMAGLTVAGPTFGLPLSIWTCATLMI